MHTRKYPLIFLIPYLGRYRARVAVGFLMVLFTVAVSMVSPWVLKYVIDGLLHDLQKETLPMYAAWILGLSVVEGIFRFGMRRILIGTSRDIEYDLRNDFLAHVQKLPLSFLIGFF